MKFLAEHKGKIATGMIVLGIIGAYLAGLVPLDEAMRQIGELLSSTPAPASVPVTPGLK
jgi:hypothetical protein